MEDQAAGTMTGRTVTEEAMLRSGARWSVAFLFATPLFLLGAYLVWAGWTMWGSLGDLRDRGVVEASQLSSARPIIAGVLLLGIWAAVGARALKESAKRWPHRQT